MSSQDFKREEQECSLRYEFQDIPIQSVVPRCVTNHGPLFDRQFTAEYVRVILKDDRPPPNSARGQVQAPFETRPGEIPRRIQIERKRRLYSQHQIESLLLDRGVNYAEPPDSALAFLGPSIRALPVEVSRGIYIPCVRRRSYSILQDQHKYTCVHDT